MPPEPTPNVLVQPERKLDGRGRRVIPDSEISMRADRSGGAGGQNVNKRATKAVLTWHVGKSGVFSEEEKSRIRENLFVTSSDEIVLHCDEERSQLQNKSACVERLHDQLRDAIQVDAERKETKKKYGTRQRELDQKTMEGKKKMNRRKVDRHE